MIQYDPSRLDPMPFFSSEERLTLHKLAAEYPLDQLCGRPRVLEEKVAEYAYVSSRIEGGTYSQVGVFNLLKYGWTEGAKPLSDALMVRDLNTAFGYVMHHARDEDVCSKTFIRDLHAMATEHQLRADESGAVLNHLGAVTGCDYRPLASPVHLEAELNILIEVLREFEDPFEQAAYAHCNMAYLLYFADGNKHTSRLLQTAVLVHHGITPLFMRAEEIQAYLSAVIRYDETGDRRPYAELFVRSYRYTIDSLLGRTPEQLAAVAEDEKRLQEAWERRRRNRTTG